MLGQNASATDAKIIRAWREGSPCEGYNSINGFYINSVKSEIVVWKCIRCCICKIQIISFLIMTFYQKWILYDNRKRTAQCFVYDKALIHFQKPKLAPTRDYSYYLVVRHDCHRTLRNLTRTSMPIFTTSNWIKWTFS